MKRLLSVLLGGWCVLAVSGCSDKAVYPSDTTKPPPTAPGQTATTPKLPDPPK